MDCQVNFARGLGVPQWLSLSIGFTITWRKMVFVGNYMWVVYLVALSLAALWAAKVQ
jgi:hypothetical protein